jgi:murein DD-endopeptidase MepM/ murein hydrolase activator NlpD
VDAGLQADPTLADPTLADPTLSGQATTPVTGTVGSLPPGTTGVLPITTGVVGSKFGARGSWSSYHTGLDFRAAYGTQIHVVLPGVVVYAGNSGDWAGNHVAVRHTDGHTTMYSHMSRMAVTTGQTVQAGQVIGYVGETGRAFGAHLHFELYPAGVRYGDVYKAVDPAPWLRSIGVVTH